LVIEIDGKACKVRTENLHLLSQDYYADEVNKGNLDALYNLVLELIETDRKIIMKLDIRDILSLLFLLCGEITSETGRSEIYN